MHTCTICETPESAVEVSPDHAKWKIYMCKPCVRAAVGAWARCAGALWSIVTRKKLDEAQAPQ